MSGNTWTVVSTLAGIVFGYMISWWFARAGRRDLQRSFAVEQKLLVELRQTLQSPRLLETAAGDRATPLSPTAPTTTTDVLVRASLGALLDERGEVSVPRLLQELARDLPDAAQSSALSSLEELRKRGRVSWQGDDVRKAGIIKVHP